MSTGYTQTLISCQIRSATINTTKIRDLTSFLLKNLGLANHQVSIRFVGSNAIRTLNRDYRGKDRATDVLSFAQKTFKEPISIKRAKKNVLAKPKHAPETLGDIVISVREAARNARGIGQNLDREIAFLIVHGLLHLGGHDHETKSETKRMFGLQRQLMTKLCREKYRPLWKNCVKLPSKSRLN